MALRGLIRQSKVRRRREMLPQQVGFVCAVLALVCCASGLFGSLGHKTASAGKHVLLDTWRNRKLMAPINGTPLAKNCTDPAIHEFPTDLFSNKERQHGAVLLHILGALYMFYALAIVCDDFFVPSLEKICEKLHLSEDVAGATFMAAGSSTPELFASVIGVFITHGDVGVGTIVGSAVFNILCIIGVCGLFAGQVVRLTWWAVCRDSVYYTLSVIVLIAFIYDEEIVWWEGLVLIILYVFYILIMKYNMKMQTFFTTKQKSIANGNPVSNELEDGNDLYDGSYDDPSVPLLGQVKEKPPYGKTPVVMVDEILSSSPPKFTFPEAGLRIMITNKFGPRTRLRMASRIIINERQRLINSANGVNSKPLQNGRHENMENGNVPVENPEDPQQGQEQQPPPQPPPPEPESVETVFLSPFSMPGHLTQLGVLSPINKARSDHKLPLILKHPPISLGVFPKGLGSPNCWVHTERVGSLSPVASAPATLASSMPSLKHRPPPPPPPPHTPTLVPSHCPSLECTCLSYLYDFQDHPCSNVTVSVWASTSPYKCFIYIYFLSRVFPPTISPLGVESLSTDAHLYLGTVFAYLEICRVNEVKSLSVRGSRTHSVCILCPQPSMNSLVSSVRPRVSNTGLHSWAFYPTAHPPKR